MIKCTGPCVKNDSPSAEVVSRLELCIAHYRQSLLRRAIERSQVLHREHGERICRGTYQNKQTQTAAARGCALAADEVATLQRALERSQA